MFPREVALDEKCNEYLRIVALQALAACGDTDGLEKVARWLKDASERLSALLGPGFAKVLFPRYITVDELLGLIECAPVPRPGTLERFAHEIGDLWKACPDDASRKRMLAGLADMCLSPPFKSSHQCLSSQHYELAKNLAPIAREAVFELRGAETTEGLVRLLMVVERVERQSFSDQEEPTLATLVTEHWRLQRDLFWMDVEQTRRQNASRGKESPTRFWHVQAFLKPLWKLGPKDLTWLAEDLSGRPLEGDKRIALSAIVRILGNTNELDTKLSGLRAMISGERELQRDLDGYLAPPIEDEELRRLQVEEENYRRDRLKREQDAKSSWVELRDQLKGDPSLVRDLQNVNILIALFRWLSSKTRRGYESALEWRLLEGVFGRPVAEAYRDGMKALWRTTSPERPKRKEGRPVTWKWVTILSFFGIGIEAAEDPDWTAHLSSAEIERAAQHACLSEQGYPQWLEDLVHRDENLVLPILHKALRAEWASQHGGSFNFISYFSGTDSRIPESIQRILFDVTLKQKPQALGMLDHGLRILQRLNLGEAQRHKAAALIRRRLRAAARAEDDERVWGYLAMLFMVDADGATREFVDWLDGTPQASRYARAESSLGALFARHRALPSAADALFSVSVESLEALIRLAYRYVRPEDDSFHEGHYTPNARDDAEQARSTLLKALIDRPGADAYQALRALSENEPPILPAVRLRELAHGKAEHDAELPAWTTEEVLDFERRGIAPANTGEILLRVVVSVLSEIQSSFTRNDATSQPLVERAEKEEEVQKWLAEQMEFRSEGRYHVHRETEVAGGDQPDIIVSSTAAKVEVAVEVKQVKYGGNDWSVRDLERSLTKKLTEDYLKPANRRWGVLVVSRHGERTFRDPETRAPLSFDAVIGRLQARAEEVKRNKFGYVEVRVCGIDTSVSGRGTDFAARALVYHSRPGEVGCLHINKLTR